MFLLLFFSVQVLMLAYSTHYTFYIGNKRKLNVFIFQDIYICREDVPLVEFMYLVFNRMPGEHYCR